MKEHLKIHDNLIESTSNDFLTWKFCAPIFITNQFGTFFDQDADLLSSENSLPKTRNGTLTFIEHEKKVYGITCRHVIDQLDKANAIIKKNFREKHKIDNVPLEALFHLFIPNQLKQLHVASHFINIPGDEFTGEYPDISIAQINPNILKEIGREPIALSETPNIITQNQPGFCGIATGYPEQKRNIKPSNSKQGLNDLAISVMVACAPFNIFNDRSIQLFAEIEDDPDLDNLSGMSGGPIFWSTQNDWGFAGIMTKARDIKSKTNYETIVQGPTIWIDGEKINHDIIIKCIETYLSKDKQIKDLTKTLYIPDIKQN